MTKDGELSFMRKFHVFLNKFIRFRPKLSSDDVKLTKSTSCDSISLSSSYTSSSYSTNYSNRDNSLDLTRNNDNEYEVVLPYQRIAKPAKQKGYKLPKRQKISLFVNSHNIDNYDFPDDGGFTYDK